MRPVVVIAGRPNVGKSTLFNRLVGEQRALVDPTPGVTRDRMYGLEKERGYIVVDTGGLAEGGEGEITSLIARSALEAMDEADLVLLMMDGPQGLTPGDRELADFLRRSGRAAIYLVNKIDGPKKESLVSEFYELGVEEILPVSAAHGLGVGRLKDRIEELLPEPAPDEEPEGVIRIAVVGRPNAGKSSLVNALVGAQRMLVSERPGTTRDAVDVELETEEGRFLLVDTAGIRRKGKTTAKLEKLSVIKALRAVERCHVAILVLDGRLGAAAQDMRIAGYISDRGRGAIVCLNKYDLLLAEGTGEYQLGEAGRGLRFLDHAPILPISATENLNVGLILPEAGRIFEQWSSRARTPELNRIIENALKRHQPPLVRGKRLKIYYIAQIRTRPPTFACVVNDPKRVRTSYRRYLANRLRDELNLNRTPIRLRFKPRKQKGRRG
jgi:GTP-binding protein